MTREIIIKGMWVRGVRVPTLIWGVDSTEGCVRVCRGWGMGVREREKSAVVDG